MYRYFLFEILMMSINYHKSKLVKIFYQLGLVLGVGMIMVAVDLLPRYEQGQITIENQVLAQTPSDADLQKYAKAAMAIETLRQNTYRDIQNTVGQSKAPQLSCHQRQNFSQLPSQARSMANDYCNQSETIVQQSGLSITRFNQITQQLKRNPELYKKVQNMMRR